MRHFAFLIFIYSAAVLAASTPANHGLGVGVSLAVGGARSGPAPEIVSTLPIDGSSIATATPQIQIVFSIDMDTTRRDPAEIVLPAGLSATLLNWPDNRTLDIHYSGALDSFGAKRVALFDKYFVSVGNMPIPNGSGLAFEYGDQQPVMVVEPSYTPAAPTTLDTITFSCQASSPIGATLNYTWNFGDGTVGSGASVQHRYASAGVYLVVVSVTDGLGGNLVGPLLVSVAVGAAALPPPAPLPWTITHATVHVNFKQKGRDKITIVGTVNLAAGFDPTNKNVSIGIGGLTASVKMDKNGRAKVGSNRFTLTRKLKKKVFLGGPVKINFTLTGDFAATLAKLGFTNATTPKASKTSKVVGLILTLPVSLTIDTQPYIATPQVIWKAKAGATGTAQYTGK